jgi:hypothetical protein
VPDDVTSKDILDRFFSVLHAEFSTDADGHRRTKRQDRSLQVAFPEYDLYDDAGNKGDDRRLSARALAEYRDETGLNVLRNLARGRGSSVAERRQAALALDKIGDSQGVQLLQELLDS